MRKLKNFHTGQIDLYMSFYLIYNYDIKNKKFDAVVSRAVAPLADLWKWSKPLIRKKTPVPGNNLTGLICLKGGDLAQEISASSCRPRSIEIYDLFKEEFFRQKYLLHVSY